LVPLSYLAQPRVTAPRPYGDFETVLNDILEVGIDEVLLLPVYNL